MKKCFILIVIISIAACGTEPKLNTSVSVSVKGLQKGVVFLQKYQDTTYITIDSLSIVGEKSLLLECQLNEPEVLYLSLSQAMDAERIEFFADQGLTTINTTLKRFVYDAKIEGSKQQKLLEDYRENLSRFKNKQLELLESSLNAQRSGQEKELLTVEKQMETNLRRQYLYSINYAINNNDNEVAPYIALADIYDANTPFLDTIYNSLTPRIAKSKYGLMLKDYIEKITAGE